MLFYLTFILLGSSLTCRIKVPCCAGRLQMCLFVHSLSWTSWMMCFVRGWVGERSNLAGDWKAASFVVFTAAAVLSMSEPSKGRLFLPFEELILALRSLCVQDSRGWSTKSAPRSLQQKIHPGDAGADPQLSLRTHPILLDSLQGRLQREPALSSSSPRLRPGTTLCCTQQNAAANK